MAGQIVAFVGLANNAKYVCFRPKPLGKKIEPSAYTANFSKIDDQVARLILWSEQRRSACANRIHKDNP